jgi:hypothetical protein
MEIGRKFSNQGLIEDYEEVKWRRVTKKELNIEDSEAKKREIQKTLSTPQRRALERVNSMSPTPGKQAARNLSPLLNKSHTQAHFTQNERKGDYSPNRPLRVVKEDTEPKRRNSESTQILKTIHFTKKSAKTSVPSTPSNNQRITNQSSQISISTNTTKIKYPPTNQTRNSQYSKTHKIITNPTSKKTNSEMQTNTTQCRTTKIIIKAKISKSRYWAKFQ